MTTLPSPTPVEIAVRAYGVPVPTAADRAKQEQQRRWKAKQRPAAVRSFGPSGWSLTFDTELTYDHAQQLRLGSYQVRDGERLHEAGFFVDPDSLSEHDHRVIDDYADVHDLVVRDVADFREAVLYRVLVQWNGVCIGFNLPLDLSRLAVDHATAKSPDYRGGFTFQLFAGERRPRLQLKHLNSTEAFIRFTYPPKQMTPRGMRKRGRKVPHTRGWFVDVHTAAAALLEHKGDLRSLAELLRTPTQKGEADFEDPAITPEFLDYAMTDSQVSWECYADLAGRYATLHLEPHLSKIWSAASLGKATLRSMGIRRWQDCQPRFPRLRTGQIMASYYGGRSEVHIRRTITRILYSDFLSMYPTVCSLMGLWRYIVAEGVETYDATSEARRLLASISVDDLQDPTTWERLTTIVELESDGLPFPVRGKYDEKAYTIGLNYLTTDGQRVWYTLADVIVAVMLDGRVPRIRRAIGFRPGPLQEGLQPVDLMGNPAYRVDPAQEDVFRRLIELRVELKGKRDEARAAGDRTLAEQYDQQQLALKILANATSYGIFIELNVTESDELVDVTCYGLGAGGFPTRLHQSEKPGAFFHPLLATLITGAARLMLGLAEERITDAGLGWVFADTDSMAVAKPEDMTEAEFLRRARGVLDWFEPLKPYRVRDRVFKLEDANYALDANGRITDALQPLYAFAVSAKRYCLFDLDGEGRPVLRKASAHGLGHLREPYPETRAPASIPAPVVSRKDLGVARWQHDLWCRIVTAALEGHPAQVELSDIEGLDAPAVSRYGATTSELAHWFDRFNAGRPYREQVRPFGFLLAYQARPDTRARLAAHARRHADDPLRVPAVVAPFDRDPLKGAQRAFDRNTGASVPIERLLTYRETLAQYHLHPEAKFEHANYLDTGLTVRRHVRPLGPIEHIGKEANRWEEQFHLGKDPEAQVGYGVSPELAIAYARRLRKEARRYCVRTLSDAAGLAVGTISKIRGGGSPGLAILRRFERVTTDPQRPGRLEPPLPRE